MTKQTKESLIYGKQDVSNEEIDVDCCVGNCDNTKELQDCMQGFRGQCILHQTLSKLMFPLLRHVKNANSLMSDRMPLL